MDHAGSPLLDGSGREVTADSPARARPLELAMQAIALSRLAGGIAHDVKNPLNAMSLQVAVLGDKIGGGGEELSTACANNLSSLKNQIGRIDELVKRFADVAEPPAGTTFDAAQLAADVASLFGYEGRRRRVAVAAETHGPLLARGDPARAARLMLGLTWRGLSHAPEGSRLTVRAQSVDGEVVVALQHAGAADPALAWIVEAAATAAQEMGGRVAVVPRQDAEIVELHLIREDAS